MHRRDLLSITAVAGIGALAGCTDVLSGSPYILQGLYFRNLGEGEATVEYTIESNNQDEAIADDTLELDPHSSHQVDCNWPDGQHLTVSAKRPEDDEWRTWETPTAVWDDDPGCSVIYLDVVSDWPQVEIKHSVPETCPNPSVERYCHVED